MALSNLELDPDILWGKSHTEHSPRPPHIHVLEDGASIDPTTLNPQSFRELNGYMQEDALVYLICAGDWDKIAEVRPDFFRPQDFVNEDGEKKLRKGLDLDTVVTGDEKTVSFLAGETIRNGLPIDYASIRNRSDLAQLNALIYPFGVEQLIPPLQREQCRECEYPDAFFTPAEDLGEFKAARRYLASLVMGAEKTLNGKHYSRDYFRPLEPVPLPEKPTPEQTEKYNREMLAHDLYLQETWLAGDPLS